MEGVEIQPHTLLKPAQVRPVVIVVGDPARAKWLASLCEKSHEMAYNREYRSFDCFHAGQHFTVASHGVGSAGAALCFEEFMQNGAKIVIRAGTAGSLQPHTIKQGDVVLCHSAAREDGVTALQVPTGFPAVADPYVFQTMQSVARERDAPVKCGMTLTSDLFYKSRVLPSTLELYSKATVEIVEMEIAALFVLARLRGVKAGALCTIDGSPLQWDQGDFDPSGQRVSDGKRRMLDLAIATAVRLSSEKRW